MLKTLIGTKPEEDHSFKNINNCLLYIDIAMLLCCVMEPVTYFVYNNKVNLKRFKMKLFKFLFQFHPRKEIIVNNNDTSTTDIENGK